VERKGESLLWRKSLVDWRKEACKVGKARAGRPQGFLSWKQREKPLKVLLSVNSFNLVFLYSSSYLLDYLSSF
jgi:hypothetical protein